MSLLKGGDARRFIKLARRSYHECHVREPDPMGNAASHIITSQTVSNLSKVRGDWTDCVLHLTCRHTHVHNRGSRLPTYLPNHTPTYLPNQQPTHPPTHLPTYSPTNPPTWFTISNSISWCTENCRRPATRRVVTLPCTWQPSCCPASSSISAICCRGGNARQHGRIG